jgi:alanine racemase
MSRPTYITIDLGAVRHNLQRVKSLTNNKHIIAMVKANAYGHGMTRIAKALNEADALGVASLDEALSLREAGITQPIFLMEGLFYPEELAEAVKQDLTLIVHHEPQLLMLEKAKLSHPVAVWLKINTGMHRLGIALEDFPSFYERLEKCAMVKKPIGLMTHFAEADNPESKATLAQIDLFNTLTASFQNPKSLANSAGILAWPASQGDWVRPGLMLYGVSPFKNKVGLDHDLKPVMTLSSRLIAIVPVKKGGSVGYGGTWTAEKDSLIGVVGVGYGDGYPQFAQNGTPVLVNGRECPLVGRVSMDMLTVNLSDATDARIGDPVILWGRGLPVERIAECARTSPYELLTRMTARPKVEISN